VNVSVKIKATGTVLPDFKISYKALAVKQFGTGRKTDKLNNAEENACKLMYPHISSANLQ
jgi:hypothetical protein